MTSAGMSGGQTEHGMMELALISLIVRDYDEAIDWYTRILGFRLAQDDDYGEKRWVVIETDGGSALLLAQAKNEREISAIGNQHGGRVGFFLHVDDFEATYRRLSDFGVAFDEMPRAEAYGQVVVFRDLYGNRWDLIGPAA
jgi:catechol 2,3-dioxygenase-like lactoylglutathione lyase family enzyme